MSEIAERCFPGRDQHLIGARRGDSSVELPHARYEWIEPTPVPYINEIKAITDAT